MNEIKNKINEIVNNLKEKISFKKSNLDSDDDTALEEEINETQTDKEDEKVAEDTVGEEWSSTTEDKDSGKKNKLIIQIILGGLVLYLVYDEFFSPSEVEPSPEITSEKSSTDQSTEPKKMVNSVTPVIPKPSPTPPQNLVKPPAATATQQPVQKNLNAPPSSLEKTKNVSLPSSTSPENSSASEKSTEISASSSEKLEISSGVSPPPEKLGTAPKKLLGGPPPLKAEEADPGASGEALAQIPVQGTTTQVPVDSKKEAASSSSTQPLPKIRQKLEYTAPPDYTQAGRGLVYNCKGQHWACVDKSSYFQCRKNYFWARQESKPPECAIKNVYANDTDCHIIHEHYLNNQQSTDFCKVLESTL